MSVPKLIATLLILALGHGAIAAPPVDADQSMTPWFHSLQTKSGLSCCGIADCRGPRTYPVRIHDGGYEVYFDNDWHKVPPDAVSDRMDNPTGAYVTCVQESYWVEGVRSPQVLCLFKAAGM